MRLPRNAPSFHDFISDADGSVNGGRLQLILSGDVQDAAKVANDKYLHWDQIRFLPKKSGVPDDAVWAAVQFMRSGQKQEIPISFSPTATLRYVPVPSHNAWLHQIDKNSYGNQVGIGGDINALKDGKRYLINSLMEEAIASSQLEGATTTRPVAKDMLRTKRKPRDRNEQMILNNYRTMMELRDQLDERLTPELLKHWQSILTEQTLDKEDQSGRFRKMDEPICVADATTGDAIYTPPNADEVNWRIDQICAFANDDSIPFIHPIAKAAILHFAIGFVHPFCDGNGRTARALFYWYALKKGFWTFEYVPISRIILRAPVKYARAYLYTETDGGDVTYFVRYHLNAILQALSSFHSYIDRELNQTRLAVTQLDGLTDLNVRQKWLLSDAITHPNMKWTISHHQGKYNVTYPTARGDLFGLVERGLFERTKIGRENSFRPVVDLKTKLHVPEHPQPSSHLQNPASIAVTQSLASEADVPEDIDPEQGLLFEVR